MKPQRSVTKKSVTSWAAPAHTAVRRLLAATTLLCWFANAHAQLVVTGANAKGDAVYDLTLNPSNTVPSVPVISGTTPVNTPADAKMHGTFDALAWVPNAFCQTSDLIAADATHAQIVRYAGASTVRATPCNNTATVSPTAQSIFSWSKSNPGPAQPNGLSVDAFGNLFVVSSSGVFDPKPSVWVLPFNASTGNYGKPVLIDSKFGGGLTLALAETLVAGAPAKTSANTVLWNAGDLLVLVGDSFDARLTVYSTSAIYGNSTSGAIATSGLPLKGPSSIAIPFAKFLQQLAAPFGMDFWPANATLGTNASVLFTTIDGRILRFDTVQNKFVANFAASLGLGLEKLKVGSYAGAPYAFVAHLLGGNGGQILEFGAPPASGANKPLSTFGTGIMEPVGLAVLAPPSNSVPPPLTPVVVLVPPSGSACPNGTCTIDPLGPLLSTSYMPGSGDTLLGPITEQYCIVDPDPRVTATVTHGVLSSWSCTPEGSPAPALQIGAATNYCPTFPTAYIPGSLCGHSGPDASGFVVVLGDAPNFDPSDNNTLFQSANNVDTVLPGPGNLECANNATTGIPLAAWGTRSDRTTVEGTIPEDSTVLTSNLETPGGFGAPFATSLSGEPGFLMDSTVACDTNTSGGHGISDFAIGLGLSSNSFASGATSHHPLYVAHLADEKYAAILQTFQNANIAFDTNTTQIQADIDLAYGFVKAIEGNGATPSSITTNVPCALQWIWTADEITTGVPSDFSSNLNSPFQGVADTDPAGDLDSRFGAWYVGLNTGLAGQATPNWPIPFGPGVCPAANTPISLFYYNAYDTYLSWIADDVDSGSCNLSSTDGTYVNFPVADHENGHAISVCNTTAEPVQYTLACTVGGNPVSAMTTLPANAFCASE
jgi:hypothetical protein